MARKQTGTTGAAATAVNKGDWTQFVSIPVAAEQAADIYKHYPTSDEVGAALEELLQDGYRVSFSYSPQTDAVTVSVTCKNEKSPNTGMTFTSFADTWYKALMVAMYKHYVVAEGNWKGGAATEAKPAFG